LLEFAENHQSTNDNGVVMFSPCLFCPSDNVWCSQRASVCALFYCYPTFLDHTTNISRQVRAPRRTSASGAPSHIQNCHLDKTNMDKTKTSQHHDNISKIIYFPLYTNCVIEFFEIIYQGLNQYIGIYHTF